MSSLGPDETKETEHDRQRAMTPTIDKQLRFSRLSREVGGWNGVLSEPIRIGLRSPERKEFKSENLKHEAQSVFILMFSQG
jgi:hypothetical protein